MFCVSFLRTPGNFRMHREGGSSALTVLADGKEGFSTEESISRATPEQNSGAPLAG